jgi:hypothetical protein
MKATHREDALLDRAPLPRRPHTPTPDGSPAAQVLALQRTVGNRAVVDLLRSAQAMQRDGKGNATTALPLAGTTTTNGRGLSPDSDAPVNDRTTGAAIGAGIGGVLGAIGGGVVGGGLGAVLGGLGGAAIGGMIGGAIGGPSAPVPIAVRNGPGHRPINAGGAIGMSIDITLTSSSGVDADMAAVQDSEQVSPSLRHTGSYTAVPAGPGDTSGYMPGHPIPPDEHTSSKAEVIDCADNHGGDGTQDFEQLDTFKAPAAGIGETVVPASGYLIRRTITVSGTKITFRVDKRPAAVTVNGFTSTAGPSAAQHDDIVVRA